MSQTAGAITSTVPSNCPVPFTGFTLISREISLLPFFLGITLLSGALTVHEENPSYRTYKRLCK